MLEELVGQIIIANDCVQQTNTISLAWWLQMVCDLAHGMDAVSHIWLSLSSVIAYKKMTFYKPSWSPTFSCGPLFSITQEIYFLQRFYANLPRTASNGCTYNLAYNSFRVATTLQSSPRPSIRSRRVQKNWHTSGILCQDSGGTNQIVRVT